VLKVAMPLEIDGDDAFGDALTVHRLAAGRGCAELLAYDASVPAMLLERLGPNLHELDLPLDRVLDAIADTLLAFWRPAGPECGLRTGAEKAAWLAEYVVTTWEALGRPCDRAVVDRAVAYCDARAAAYDPEQAVLVHGDAHGWNTLAAGDAFKLVDPEGLRSDRAHDLSVPMREYNEPLLGGDTAALVRARAERLGAAQGHAFLEVARRCLPG
jgi:streptomycin 6-kinase